MQAIIDNVNWLAVIVGTVLAFVLGMFWFSPKMFGKSWSQGSHGIEAPQSPPVGALVVQLFGTFLLAWAIGVTETTLNLAMAVLVSLAIAALQLAGGLLSQKTPAAALIDASYVIAMAVLMVLAQAAL